MKYLAFLFIGCLALFAQPLFACSCVGTSAFCQAIEYSDYTAEVEVAKVHEGELGIGIFYDLKITDYLVKKSSFDGDKLGLVQYGTSCDIWLEGLFEKGDRLIITFSEPDSVDFSDLPAITFWQCGTNFVKIRAGFAIGDITRYSDFTDQRMILKQLKNNITNLCDVNIFEEGDLSISPNLSDSAIALKNFTSLELEYQVYDAAGRFISDGTLVAEGINNLSITDYAAGLYFIRFSTEYGQFTRKFVKV